MDLAFNTSYFQSGLAYIGKVRLKAPAKTQTPVAITFSDARVRLVKAVVVPKGAIEASFTVLTTAVTTDTVVTIRASVGTDVDTLEVPLLTVSSPLIPGPQSISLSLNPVPGWTTLTGTVTMNVAAGPGGVQIALTASDASVVIVNSIHINEGQTQATFSIRVNGPATNRNCTLRATLGRKSATVILALLYAAPPLAQLVSFRLNSDQLQRGAVYIGMVTLPSPALAPVTVSLTLPTGVTGTNPIIAKGRTDAIAILRVASDAPTGVVTLTGQIGTTTPQSATATIL